VFLTYGDYIFFALGFAVFLFVSKPYLHAVQLDGYKAKSLFKARGIFRQYLYDALAAFAFIALWVIFFFIPSRAMIGLIFGILFFIYLGVIHILPDRQKKKKPLKYTKRAIRLMVFNALLLSSLELIVVGLLNGRFGGGYARYLIYYFSPFFFPLVFALSTVLIYPLERLIHACYNLSTRRKLRKRKDLIKIAVTGSYAKTSVKNYLCKILEKRYKVLCTPASYNTPMGVSLTVKKLTELDEVFICEMGARKTGDIEELMKIIEPQHAVLTGISNQHLETFKTVENIVAEKTKVLNVTGVKVAAGDCKLVPRIDGVCYVGEGENNEIRYGGVQLSENGSCFVLHLDDGDLVIKTSLLGKHNIANLALAAAAAYKLGAKREDIESAIAEIEAVPHRLSKIYSGGITIIDDSFNSNSVGARCALDVLSLFGGRKIVVTPGLVELGKDEEEENFNLGKDMAAKCDIAILIGFKRSKPIKEGLISGGFEPSNIYIYDTLFDAQKNFQSLFKAGDTVLILNDLPDNY